MIPNDILKVYKDTKKVLQEYILGSYQKKKKNIFWVGNILLYIQPFIVCHKFQFSSMEI